MDIWSINKRSDVMRKIRGKDTKPELLLRRYLWSIGFRYRLHDKNLAGTPDIVLAKYKTAIFVHGCFWHQHKRCREGRIPSSNKKFWFEKLTKNEERDQRNISLLKKAGWKVIVVWECDIEKNIEKVGLKLFSVLIKET